MLQRLAPKPGEKSPPPGRSASLPTQQAQPRETTATQVVEEAPKPRLFSVPPPPFMDQAGAANKGTGDQGIEEMLSEVRDMLRTQDEKDESEDSKSEDSNKRDA